jgi:hypothetical protein
LVASSTILALTSRSALSAGLAEGATMVAEVSEMIARHHLVIMLMIGLAMVALAIAVAMEPGVAHGLF